MTVKEAITQFENIFDSVNFFIPLNIYSPDLYLMWLLRYSNYKYISDDKDEIKSYIDILTKIYTKKSNQTLQKYIYNCFFSLFVVIFEYTK